MRLLSWLIRGFLFFALFAFALNNQHGASLHWFFGLAWEAPMVFIVLGAFGLGTACGVLAMLLARSGPWRARILRWRPRLTRRQLGATAVPQGPATAAAAPLAPSASPSALDGNSKDDAHGV